MLQINHILLLLILLAFPHGLPDHRFMLQFVLTAPPQDHEPYISSTISLPICEPLSISPTSYRNSPMGPPPLISFLRNFCPPWGIHSTLGHPFLYFVHLSHIYLLFFVQTPFLPAFAFCRHRWRPAFLLATRNPCHPWLEHHFSFTLADIVYIFRVLPRSFTILSSGFVHLVPPLAQLSPGLVIPLTLDLVTWLRPLFLSISPPTKGSLESSHFLTSSMHLCHFITSVDSTEYLFASGSRVTFCRHQHTFSKRATVSWSSFPIQ
jgi:hypothetical protein